ncbi:MAG TPA: flavodoxin [Pyrinomonadaceae bacterium]|nr:flavodoxin [Pyrinomonadaceae bacterium]
MKVRLLSIILLIGLTSCYAQTSKQNEAVKPPDKQNILIVYLSRTGNTEAVAKMIQKEVGGDLVSLEIETPYPKNFEAIVKKVVEENEKGFLPPLKTKIENIEKYNTIFLGFPTWGMQLPPPMKSFLNQYDVSGKTVIPFNTNAGYGVGSSFRQVKELAPRSTVLEGFEIKGGIERDGVFFVMEGEKEKQAQTDIKQWLQRIKILKSAP